MEIKLPIKNFRIHESATIEDLKKIFEISFNGDAHDLLVYKHENESMRNETIFYGHSYCGRNEETSIMFDIEMDNLEVFATAILKQIELIRMNYSAQIKFQTDMGNCI
jgi:hypothetical protein